MLLKALADVKEAPRPLAAAEMALVRIAYAADLPTPDEVMRSLGEEKSSGARPTNGGASASTAPSAGGSFAPRYDAPRSAPRGSAASAASPNMALSEPAARSNESAAAEPVLALTRFEDLIALAAEKRDLTIKAALERDVRLVRFEDGQLEIGVMPSAAKTFGRRSVPQARGLDRPALDGGGVVGGGRANGPPANGNGEGRADARRARRSAGAIGAATVSRR